MQKFLTAMKLEAAPAINAMRSVKDVIVIPTPEARSVAAILSSTVDSPWAPDKPESKMNMSSIPIPVDHTCEAHPFN